MTKSKKLTQKQIEQLLKDEAITLSGVIDAVIDVNGIIGVGIITLADDVNAYIRSKGK